MKKNTSRRGSRQASAPIEGLTAAKEFFSANGGRWATQMLKAAAMEGRALSASALRTLDTLRHEEWKFFDDALVEEAMIRLVGVGDLIGAGLVRPVSNALAKTVFAYEKVTFMDVASISLDGTSRTANDRQEFELNQIPLPITHKDFFINLRTLAASREKGEALDTTQVRTAGRVVIEAAEKMLFQGGPTFGTLPIYGYTTHPDRLTQSFDASKNWGDATKTGASYLVDVLAAFKKLQSATNRMFGPYWVYVDSAAGVQIENDYNAATANTQTIRQRIEAIQGIKGIRVADQMPANTVVFVQATADTAVWVQGETLQTVQWDEGGGFTINFKAFQIGVPLIRSDAQHRSGVCHMS